MSSLEVPNPLCSLMAPSCQLYENCQLWREYLRCQLSSEIRKAELNPIDIIICSCCGVHCDCLCHRRHSELCRSSAQGWSDEEILSDSAIDSECREKGRADTRGTPRHRERVQKVKPATAADADSGLNQAALRQAALADWHTRKAAELDASRAALARKQSEDEAKRSEAKRIKSEEGQAAYQSWLAQKRQTGLAKQRKDQSTEAEVEQKQASTQAAIEKWLSRKGAEEAERRQRRRAQESEARAAREAEKAAMLSSSASKRDAWEARKKQEARQKRQSKREAENLAADEELQAMNQKRESAKLRYQDWCDKKDSLEVEAANTDGQKQKQQKNLSSAPWRPNSTVRRK